VLAKIGPLFLLLAGCSHLSAGTVDFQLTPSNGNISGMPGDQVGWGFTITNTTSQWLFFMGSSLDFETNPTLGTYTDFFQFNSGNDTSGPLALVDPMTSTPQVWSAGYSLLGPTGVGDYWIDPGAALGLNDSGTITVNYLGLDCNPNDSSCSDSGTPGSVSAAFNVSVQTPEPSPTVPLALLAATWAAFALRRRFAK
jgi:hypothetical protein